MKFRAFSTEFEIDEGLITESKEEIRRQLEQYFSGNRNAFDLEVSFPEGFTGDVMREMAKISHGETRTYGEIAEALDSSAVAVGQACGRNSVPLIVPCHRVVGKSSIGGYAYGKEVKKRLLDMER
jgi:methylated-DNA-[protein]-cysteine S-methyltransferase